MLMTQATKQMTLAAAVTAALVASPPALAQRSADRPADGKITREMQAQRAVERPVSEMDPLAAPPIMTSGGVRYMTGGVAVGERDAMQRAARDFNLRLAFTEARQGNYVAFVDVSVTDRNGREVLSIDDAGPWLYADLPPGSYTVRATYDGRTETRKVRIGASSPGVTSMQWRSNVDRG
jgi:hypothetical protein